MPHSIKVPPIKFCKKSPCDNCPYRKDAPREYWDKREFSDLLKNEMDEFGKVYQCHKRDGNVCVGWLMNQDKRRFPSLALRLALSAKNITRKYLDSLHCKHEQFDTVEEMIEANFPELLHRKASVKKTKDAAHIQNE